MVGVAIGVAVGVAIEVSVAFFISVAVAIAVAVAVAQNLGSTWPVHWYKGALMSSQDSIPMTQTLWIYLIQMWEAV